MTRFSQLSLAGSACLALASCGGGSTPTAPVTPQPTPTPVAVASPTPSPTPDPACGPGLCEPPTTNTSPPVRVFLRLYQLFDAAGNWVQPTPDPVKQVVVEPMPVGYTIRIDIQGRDVEDKPTNGKGDVQIIVSDPLMVDLQISSHYQRKIKILKAGKWEMYTTLDGVASNSLGFTFCDPAADAACKYP